MRVQRSLKRARFIMLASCQVIPGQLLASLAVVSALVYHEALITETIRSLLGAPVSYDACEIRYSPINGTLGFGTFKQRLKLTLAKRFK